MTVSPSVTLRQLAERATPGPWAVDADDENLDVRAPEHAVARVAGAMTMEPDADPTVKTRALADANLIALAPDLAALLADMADVLEGVVARIEINAEAGAPKEWWELLARFRALDDDRR